MDFFNIYLRGNKNKKQVALTFDDGPSKETKEILNTLKRYNAKSTFFVLGARIKGREKIIKRIIREGHEVGNHSYSHKRLWFKDKKSIEEDILKTDQKLKKLGIKTSLFRPPSFAIGFNLLFVCRKLNKKIIGANIISGDVGKFNINKVIYKILRKIKNGSIVSLHDYTYSRGRNEKVGAILRGLIPKLKENNYQIVTVSKVLK